MSTIDSQLLVCSSTLTEDFYLKVIKKDASQKELIFISRMSVIIISVIATLMAYNPENTVLDLVEYAWGGFGAAFWPLILFSLFSKNTGWKGALAGMLTGTIVLILWKRMGLSLYIYELAPGFLANSLTIMMINVFNPQDDSEIIAEFESVKNESKL
jgi:sodium/proline symporter